MRMPIQVGYFSIKEFANVSHELTDKENITFFGNYFDMQPLSNDLSRSHPEKFFQELVSNKIKYIYCNQGLRPDLLKYRTENNIDIQFIIWPYVYEQWKERYKELSIYISKKDIILTFSTYLRKKFVELFPEECLLDFPVPIDTRRFSMKKKNENELHIVYCGRFIRGKNIHMIVKALSKIPEIPVTFHIISDLSENYENQSDNYDSEYYSEIKTMLEKYSLTQNVIFHGSLAENQAKKNILFSQSDILIYPTTYEGETFGKVVVEAFATGMVVITTQWQAVNELVKDDVNGYVITPEGSWEEQIAYAIQDIWNNPKKRKQIQEHNVETAKAFDYHRHVKHIKDRIVENELSKDKHDNALVIVANKEYFEKAQQLMASAYFSGGWTEDIILLTDYLNQNQEEWCKKHNIIVKALPYITQIQIKEYNPIIFHKYYLFSDEFADWERIIFLDVDIIVCKSLERLKKLEGLWGARDLAHSPMSVQFLYPDLRDSQGEKLFREIEQKYNLHECSFNTGVLVITREYRNNTIFNDLVKLLEKYYSIAYFSDQSIFNIYFRKQVKFLPQIYNSYTIVEPKNKKIPTAVLHFAGWEVNTKPWHPKNTYYEQWINNLKKCNKINIEQPEEVKRISKEEIKKSAQEWYTINEKVKKNALFVSSVDGHYYYDEEKHKRRVKMQHDENKKWSCNNNCIFCSNSLKQEQNKKYFFCNRDSQKGFIAQLKKEKGKGKKTKVITNGRIFSIEKFAKVVLPYIDEIEVLYHGNSKEEHDGITQVPGSYEQAKKGEANIRRYHKPHESSFS
jgi:glycosyltransferase involved in cell wall biosynthesis/lipopolysaccharide biosynthesis glycosyltransferase